MMTLRKRLPYFWMTFSKCVINWATNASEPFIRTPRKWSVKGQAAAAELFAI